MKPRSSDASYFSRPQAQAGGKWTFILTFGLVSFLLYVFFCIAPAVTSIGYGFFDVSSGNLAARTFVGYGNYVRIFQDPIFWKALANDFIIIAGKLVIIMVFTILFSIGMTRLGLKKAEVGIYRVLLYMPAILSVVFIVYFWDNFFEGNFGLFAKMMGTNDVSYKSAYPLPIIIFVASWAGIGYYMIILISAINNIPASLYEAARLDGAGEFKQLFRITLPAVRSQLVFLAVTVISGSLAGNMNLVLPFYGVTDDRMLVMGTYIYYYANNKYQLGYSNAAAVLLMIISFVLCYSLNEGLTKGEEAKR